MTSAAATIFDPPRVQTDVAEGSERHLQQGVAAFADRQEAIVGLIQLLLHEGKPAIFGFLERHRDRGARLIRPVRTVITTTVMVDAGGRAAAGTIDHRHHFPSAIDTKIKSTSTLDTSRAGHTGPAPIRSGQRAVRLDERPRKKESCQDYREGSEYQSNHRHTAIATHAAAVPIAIPQEPPKNTPTVPEIAIIDTPMAAFILSATVFFLSTSSTRPIK